MRCKWHYNLLFPIIFGRARSGAGRSCFTLNGTVSDSSGGTIQGASIDVVSASTGFRRQVLNYIGVCPEPIRFRACPSAHIP